MCYTTIQVLGSATLLSRIDIERKCLDKSQSERENIRGILSQRERERVIGIFCLAGE